jgi:hypothetical protein
MFRIKLITSQKLDQSKKGMKARCLSIQLVSLTQIVLLVGIVNCVKAVAKTEAENAQWQQLFNGKSLDNWEVRGGFAKYEVKNGIIVGTTTKGSPNTFLCTRKKFGDFVLEFEVKVDPELNSGVQIRSHAYRDATEMVVWRGDKKEKTVHRAGQVFGYQVEISNEQAGSSGGVWDEARKSIWLYDVSKDPVANKAFKDNQWNIYRIACIGDSIKTWINDVPCADLRDSVDLIGFIGLQVHSFGGDEPAQVQWRNIRIKEKGRHVWAPLFDGRTLQGWHTAPGGNWKLHDGIIEGTNTSEDERNGLLVSDKCYGDFTVRLKFKAVKGNSGFYFRADKVKDSVAVNGLQVEIDESKDVGGLYETGGRGWVVKPSSEEVKKWFKLQYWNEMTVSAHGRRIVVHVNGQKTAELKNDQGRLDGHFALQLHPKQDMHVMFKDIEMLLPIHVKSKNIKVEMPL